MNRRPLITILLVGLAGIGLYRVTEPFRMAGTTGSCQTNLKQIGLTMMQYVRDYDEQFPPASHWAQVLLPYCGYRNATQLPRMFTCPSKQAGYSYNQYCSNLTIPDDVRFNQTPVIFDSMLLLPNANDKGDSWPRLPIHRQFGRFGNNVLFLDGHVKLLSQKPLLRSLVLPSNKQEKPKPSKKFKLSP